jgi:hypothetical protein
MEGIGRILTKYEDAKPQTPIERLLGSVLQIFSPWVPHVGQILDVPSLVMKSGRSVAYTSDKTDVTFERQKDEQPL